MRVVILLKNIKKIIVFLIVILGICFLSGKVNAGDLNLNDLKYDIQLNSDGSMDVIERWNIYIENTNTLFKTFEADEGYSEIVNAEVYEINSDGSKSLFEKIDKEMYHVTKGSYYALVNSDNKFEIAWGASVENETKTYELHYKVLDCIKNYNDCSEIYWQLISNDSGIPADKITGTIKLPSKVNDIENLRAWGHGPINGDVSIDSEDTVSFEIEYLDPYNLLEFRIAVLENNIFSGAKIINENKFDDILNEETISANEANANREKYIQYLNAEKQRKENIINTLRSFIILVIAFYGWKIIKYFRLLIKNPKNKPSVEYDYFREIPNEETTPAEAAYMYYFEKNNMSVNISKVLSATILDLALKKYIEFSVDNSKRKEQIIITILGKNDKQLKLKQDEEMIYDLLCDVASKYNGAFTLKEFEKYAKSHYSSFLEKVDSLKEKAEDELEKKDIYDKEIIKNATKWNGKSGLYGILGAVFFFMSLISGYVETMLVSALLFVVTIVIIIMCSIMYKRERNLTQKGIDEAEKWKGLKRYMEDFSLLNEREVPELVLWEKYLVFATAFGIADKVLKQLKIKYPELADANYSYMPLIYSNSFNSGFLNSFDKSVNNVYHAGISERAMQSGYSGGNYSSGGGFGGGFSGGGGGFGGGSMGGR